MNAPIHHSCGTCWPRACVLPRRVNCLRAIFNAESSDVPAGPSGPESESSEPVEVAAPEVPWPEDLLDQPWWITLELRTAQHALEWLRQARVGITDNLRLGVRPRSGLTLTGRVVGGVEEELRYLLTDLQELHGKRELFRKMYGGKDPDES